MKTITLDDSDLIYIKSGMGVQKDDVLIEYEPGHDEEWTHVYPEKDTYPHNTEELNCTCNPRYDLENLIVVHNSWDMREAEELL